MGPLYLRATGNGISEIYWIKKSEIETRADSESDSDSAASRHLERATKQLSEYFAGGRREFDLEFDLQGTAFQIKVWKELLKIPFGKTLSYLELAQEIENEKAFRAVGSANGRNPISIIIPCHRVIASDGKLGGYSGGLDIKVKLLRMEQLESLRELSS